MEKVRSILLAAAMLFSFGCVTAFADGGIVADGTYSVAAVFTDTDEQNPIAPVFADTADVAVSGDTAVMSVYIADPIPAGDGASSENISVADPVVTVEGTDYAGTVSTQDATKAFRASAGRFSIAEGAVLTCDTVTFTLPVSAFTADGTSSFVLTMYVGPVPNAEVSVRVDISGIPSAAVKETAEQTQNEDAEETQIPDEAAEVSLDGTADETPGETLEETLEETDEEAEKNEQEAVPSYTVTVPASVAMGSLSADTNTTRTYTVAVEASNMGDGHIDITAPPLGALSGTDGTIVFANALSGNTDISENTNVTGTLTVSADNAAAAAPGSYAGILNFTISYYAD